MNDERNKRDNPTVFPPPPAEQTRQEMLEHADKLTALIQGLVEHRGWIIEMAERKPGGSVRS